MRDEFGKFKKGIVPWNKGKKNVYTEEVLKRMSEAKKGKHISPHTEFKKGNVSLFKGTKGVLKANKTSFKTGHTWPPEIEIPMRAKIREKTVIKPNLEVNENLGYVLGVLLGDGCVFKGRGTYMVVLDVCNKKFAYKFSHSISTIGLNPSIKEVLPTNGIGKLKKYVVVSRSLLFGQWYKSLTFQKIGELLNTKDSMIGFVRGFYDSEGSLYIRKEYRTPRCLMFNTNKDLLELVKGMADKLGIVFRLYGPYNNQGHKGFNNCKPIYRISTSSNDDGYRFLEIVKPTIKNGDDING